MLLEVSGQTEVTNLHQLVVTDQDVPRCQVSVDTLRDKWTCQKINQALSSHPLMNDPHLFGGQEVHGLAHLEGEADEIMDGEKMGVIQKG